MTNSSPRPQSETPELPSHLHLERRLREMSDTTACHALIVVGIDGFGAINRLHGHMVGDDLLKAIADRIVRNVRLQDLVVRLQGDEFAILMRLDDADHSKTVARRLLHCMQLPFWVRGVEVDVSASIGVAVNMRSDSQPQQLLIRASTAMRVAKDLGRNRFVAFDASMESTVAEIDLMVCDLRRAVRDGELFLLYQPKLDMASGRVIGVEALLRWNHPEHGIIAPDYFVPLAEKTGTIVEIGRWVLNEACRQLRIWRDECDVDWNISMKTSVFQISSPSFVFDVGQALERHGVDPSDLCIEVTESSALRNADLILAVLRELAAQGVRISLDDFGVGYSSLVHLKRFPVEELKIDRSFVSGIAENGEDTAVVEAIIALGKAIGLYVVAEGVETIEQQAILAELNCDAIQGNLIGAPSEPSEIIGLAGSASPSQVAMRRWLEKS